MTKIVLKAEKRSVFGKKVKKLRKKGFVPANIFGKKIASQAIIIQKKDFLRAYKEAGSTQVVYVVVDKDKLPGLIQNIQKDPIHGNILHVDIKHVNLKEKIEAEVPIEIVGENKVIKTGEADLITLADSVLVEALPTHIPEKLEIDISKLGGIGSEVRVADLPKNKNYVFVDDLEKPILTITESKKEEIEPQKSPEPEDVEVSESGGQKDLKDQGEPSEKDMEKKETKNAGSEKQKNK